MKKMAGAAVSGFALAFAAVAAASIFIRNLKPQPEPETLYLDGIKAVAKRFGLGVALHVSAIGGIGGIWICPRGTAEFSPEFRRAIRQEFTGSESGMSRKIGNTTFTLYFQSSQALSAALSN